MPDDVLIQFDSPGDEHWVARNMQGSEINKYIEKSASSWLLTRSGQCVKMIVHLHVGTSLRMRGVLHPLRHLS